MPWPQAGADSKHPGLAGGGPRLAARGWLLMRGYPSCKVCLALGAAAPPPQPELRAVTKAAVTYPLSTQWAGPFRRPSTHQRLICPGCRRRRGRIFNGGDGDISQWAHGACVDTWQLPCRGRFSWPLLASASRVRFSCPLLAPASCVRSSCPLLVSASRVLFLCPLLVPSYRVRPRRPSCPLLVSASRVLFLCTLLAPSYRVRPSCLLLVSAFVSASCVRSLLVSTSRVRFLGPLLVSASRVRFSRPLLVPASRARLPCPPLGPLLVSAYRVRLSSPLLVPAPSVRLSCPLLAARVRFWCQLLVSATCVRFSCPLPASSSRVRFLCPPLGAPRPPGRAGTRRLRRKVGTGQLSCPAWSWFRHMEVSA